MQGFVPQPDPQQHPLPPWEINDTRNSRPIPPFLFVNRKGVPRADINDKNRTRIKDNYQKHKHRLENDYNLTFLPKKPRMASRFTTASPGPDQDTTPKAPAMSDEVEKNDRAIHNALEKGCETRPKVSQSHPLLHAIALCALSASAVARHVQSTSQFCRRSDS